MKIGKKQSAFAVGAFFVFALALVLTILEWTGSFTICSHPAWMFFFVLAAGLVLLAVLGSAFIGAVLLVFGRRKKVVDTPFILIVQCDSDEWEEQARALVEKSVRRMSLKSKSVEGGRVELNYEVRLQEGSSRFVNELDALPGVSRAVLVSYNGDYMN